MAFLKPILILTALTCTCIAYTQKPVDRIMDISDQYSIFNTAEFKEKAVFMNGKDTLHADQYWKHFKMIRDSELKDGQFKGSIGFGFNGDDSPNDDLYAIHSSINIAAGTFPHQLKIGANFNFINDDGRISENVSDISLAFDHHPKTKNPDKLFRENFVFLKRFTDQFMQVNQRYELGAGAIFCQWSKKLKSISAQDKIDRLDAFIIKTDSDWQLCHENFCQVIDPAFILDDEEFTSIEDAKERTKNRIRKRDAQSRIGLLIGPFIEFEDISQLSKDSVLMYSPNQEFLRVQDIRSNFEPDINLRVALRPIFEWHRQGWSLEFHPYFKLPMPWDWEKENKVGDHVVTNKADYRLDIQTSFVLNIPKTGSSVGSSNELVFSHRYLYDNTPNATYFNSFDEQGSRLGLIASDEHHIFSMQFKVNF